MRCERHVVVVMVVASGCFETLNPPTDARLECVDRTDCPPDWLCLTGRCIGPDAIDTTPPSLAAPPVVETPFVGPRQPLVVVLHTAGVLKAPPTLVVSIDGPPASCAADGEKAFRCTWTPPAGLAKDVDATFDVALENVSGLRVTLPKAGTFRFDSTPPAILEPSVRVLLVNESVRRIGPLHGATDGTSVEVEVVFNEPLSAPPQLVTDPPGVVFEVKGTGEVYEALHVVQATDPQGEYTLSVVARDRAGNTLEAALPIGQDMFDVDRTPPPLPRVATPGVVVHHRWPAGADFDPVPHFNVTVAAGELEEGALCRVSVGGDPFSELGLAPAQDDGGCDVALSSIDVERVDLSIIDESGNPSAAVEVLDGDVTVAAAPSPGAVTRAVLDVTTTPRLDPALAQDAGLVEHETLENRENASHADGATLDVTSARTWVSMPPAVAAPGARERHAGAFDAMRRKFVVFGGRAPDGSLLGDTWEWSEETRVWSQIRVPEPRPSARRDHGLAWDAATGRAFLFGGLDATGDRNDLWEWNAGAGRWTEILASPGPAAREGFGIAFDAKRRRLMLFGGAAGNARFGDLWTFDVVARVWTQEVADDAALARRYAGVAWDTARDRLVVYGGLRPNGSSDQLLSWSPGKHVLDVIEQTGPRPPIRNSAAFTVLGNAEGGKYFVFGGYDAPVYRADAWLFDPALGSWSALPLTGAALVRREGAATGFDAVRGVVMMYGGTVQYPDGDLRNSRQMVVLNPRTGDAVTTDATDAVLPERDEPAQAQLDAGDILLYGGSIPGVTQYSSDLLVWGPTRRLWVRRVELGVGQPAPPPLRAACLASDDARSVIFLFGGDTGPSESDALWIFDRTTATWRTAPRSSPWPTPRSHPACAVDRATGALWVIGGGSFSVAGFSDEAWRYDPAEGSWTSVPPALPVPTPYRAAAAAVPGTRALFTFGGLNYDARADAYSYDGTTRSTTFSPPGAVSLTTSGAPPPRAGAKLVFDPDRNGFALFGGEDVKALFSDTWTFKDNRWSRDVVKGPLLEGRRDAVLGYDPLRGRLIVAGGSEGSAIPSDSWESPYARERPALLAELPLSVAGVSSGDVRSLDIRGFAAGTGSALVTGVNGAGAELRAWDAVENGWRTVATTTRLIDPITFTATADDATRLLIGASPTLHLAVTTASPNGAAPTPAKLSVDDLRVTLRYRRSPVH